MPSPIAEQVKEFEKAGYPVKKGVRQILSKPGDKNEVSSYWVHRWAKHACQNYPIVKRSAGVSYLKNACINIPAFVVGIGPSLDDNITELKQTRRRALVIATDAAVRPLLANGIHIDMVVSLDCQKAQYTLWQNIPPDQLKEIPLVVNSCTHPHTIEKWPGPILFYNQFHMTDEFTKHLLPYIFPKTGSLPSAGTVGNMAILLAKHMGCGPVYTVGFDLCYKERDVHLDERSPETTKVWQYRCSDWAWETSCEVGMPPRWVRKDDRTLYKNDERIAQSSEEMVKTQKYRTDDALKSYRESLLGITDGLSFKPVDCSGEGVLREYFRSVSITQAVMESCREELSDGRTIVGYLHKSTPNGKALWRTDKENGHNY